MFASCIFILGGIYAVTGNTNALFHVHELPSWIKDNPAFHNHTEINVESGTGEITSNASDSLGWVVTINNETGQGVEIILNELVLDNETDNYLMLAGWPISEEKFKEIKILKGKFQESKTFRILNSKQFIVLFHSAYSNISPRLELNFTRYGSAYKKITPPPDDPLKKETLYEVHLKGRNSSDFSNNQFLIELKEAIKNEANAYCLANNIPFDENKTTEDMVKFRRISFCPFDWPDRDICVSLQHSVFVSGEKIPDEDIIMNYQLTADKLKDMWMQDKLPKIEDLGLFVFTLPPSSSLAIWWTVIALIAVVGSLAMIFVSWKADNRPKKFRNSSLNSNNFKDEVIRKKPRFKISKHQQIPAFVLKEDMEKSFMQDELTLKSSNSENLSNGKSNAVDASYGSPIKNYFGGFMFGINKGFEDDENTEAWHDTK